MNILLWGDENNGASCMTVFLLSHLYLKLSPAMYHRLRSRSRGELQFRTGRTAVRAKYLLILRVYTSSDTCTPHTFIHMQENGIIHMQENGNRYLNELVARKIDWGRGTQ